MLHPKSTLFLIRCALVSTCVALLTLTSCSSAKLLLSGGEKQVKHHLRPPEPGPYILIFAFDGAGYDQLMTAIQSGKAPAMAGMLGKPEGGGLYEHAYSVPNTVSILPSTTIAAWSAIFTGAPTAWNGVPGNEWFVREEMKFYAPVPVSVDEMDDNRAMITDGLVGKSLKSPTLFQQAGVKSAVSLNRFIEALTISRSSIRSRWSTCTRNSWRVAVARIRPKKSISTRSSTRTQCLSSSLPWRLMAFRKFKLSTFRESICTRISPPIHCGWKSTTSRR